MECAFV